MSFLTWAALGIGLLVVAPLIAHLLRRRPPEEEAFAATKLVPARTAVAQRRTAIEDKVLFAIRSVAILGLALLGATPFVKCSRLSLAREGGASVAVTIVLDDSLSMRAALTTDADSVPRFERARRAALELLAGLEPGDAASVVLAGDPPRVALATTTNLDAARATLEGAEVSDRGTDLESAVKIAGELLATVEHVDKRIVVLSDLAQGGPDAPALAAPEGVKLWVPLDELRGPRFDCGVVQADRAGVRLSIRVVCTPGYAAEGEKAGVATERRIEVRVGDRRLVDEKLRIDDATDIVLRLPEPADDGAEGQLVVALTGSDALPDNDTAPVVSIGGQLHAGVVSDAAARPPTGGPPMVEQAFAAIGLHVQLRPLSAVPDRGEDLRGLSLLILDDVPGLTPSQRRDVAAWVERGGVLLLTLGPNAAHAPLGSGFSPMLEGLVRWTRDAPSGLAKDGDLAFREAFEGLDELSPRGRAKLDLGPDDAFETLATWSDGAPFLLQKKLGRGVVTVTTLPFDPESSDFTLRLGFLHLLHRVTTTARALAGTSRTTVGKTWTFEGFDTVEVAHFGPRDVMAPVEVTASPNGQTRRVATGRIGLYEVTLDETKSTRVAAMAESEVDTRPRNVASDQESESLGGVEASVDISHYIAIGLLALMLAELVVRLLSPRWAATGPAEGIDANDDAGDDASPPAARDAA